MQQQHVISRPLNILARTELQHASLEVTYFCKIIFTTDNAFNVIKDTKELFFFSSSKNVSLVWTY